MYKRIVFAAIWLSLLAGCAHTPSLEHRVRESADFSDHLFIFTFDRDGRLVNPLELHRATERLRSGGIKKLLVLSYGWANESVDANETYPSYIRKYLRIKKGESPDEPLYLSSEEKQSLSDLMIIGVAWDSSLVGFSRLFADLVPSPTLGNTLAVIPDIILFPVSFWSKASLADRIGFGGLKDALEELLYKGGREHHLPQIYAIGHSFGARVVSNLLQTRQGEAPISETFRYLDQVRGAMLIQPALVSLNLPRGGPHPWRESDREFPVVVTQSRHDHANGLLFPIGNLPANTYVASAIEGVFTEWGECKRRTHLSSKWKTFIDFSRIPVTTIFTILATPISYGLGQVEQILNRHINYIPDTLAQLPGAEILVWGIDEVIMRPLGMQQFWGNTHKGAFSLGYLNESAGRLDTQSNFPPYSIETYLNLKNINHRVIFVDVSAVVNKGIFWDLEYTNPAIDFTVGWFDPVGSHFHYHDESVYKIMDRLLTNQITVTTHVDDTYYSSFLRQILPCTASQ